MLRRLGPRRDGGAGAAEYVGLIVLAALVLGGLYAGLRTVNVPDTMSAAVCRIFGGDDCGKPRAGGGEPGDTGGATASPSPGQTGGDQGTQPSLADLQKKADDAQKAANDADGKYGNVKQQIIDLLKDFIGITDIEECITKGSISSCLWAAFDVGSLIFAALKIGKFAKAVKDAIVLWKDFNRGRKIIDRAKDAARRARELLKRKHVACGLPAAFTYPNAPPGPYVLVRYQEGDDYNQAMNKALKWLEERGFKAEKPTIGKFGDTKGKPIGYRTADGKTGFRVEFDQRNGAHINVFSGKEKGPHFTFKGSPRTVRKIQGRYNCR